MCFSPTNQKKCLQRLSETAFTTIQLSDSQICPSDSWRLNIQLH